MRGVKLRAARLGHGQRGAREESCGDLSDERAKEQQPVLPRGARPQRGDGQLKADGGGEEDAHQPGLDALQLAAPDGVH